MAMSRSNSTSSDLEIDPGRGEHIQGLEHGGNCGQHPAPPVEIFANVIKEGLN